MATLVDIRLLYQAMNNPDTLVVELDYVDSKGQRSRRKVSPIRRTGRYSMLMMCLTAGEPRLMKFSGISSVKLHMASEVLIPEPKILSIDAQSGGQFYGLSNASDLRKNGHESSTRTC